MNWNQTARQAKSFFQWQAISCPLLLLSLLSTLAWADPFNSTEWRLGKERNGVKVYLREVKGYATKAREIKSVVYTQAPPSRCLALLKDYNASKIWRKRLKKLSKIDAIDQNNWYVKIETDLPWPLKDREVIAKVSLSHNEADNSYSYKVETEPSLAKNGLEENESFRGVYQFIPTEEGGSQIIYNVLFVSPIKVPNWLIDLMIQDSFVNQMDKFRQIVELPDYNHLI